MTNHGSRPLDAWTRTRCPDVCVLSSPKHEAVRMGEPTSIITRPRVMVYRSCRTVRRTIAGLALLASLAVVVSSLTACGGSSMPSNAASPWVVCGTTLINSAASPVVTDATTPAHTIRVGNETVGGIALLTSRDCDHGAALSITPSEAALVTRSAPTKDGAVAGATISSRRAQFTITVRHTDGTATVVKVDLGANFKPRAL